MSPLPPPFSRCRALALTSAIGLALCPAALAASPAAAAATTAGLRVGVRAGSAHVSETISCPGAPADLCGRIERPTTIRLLIYPSCRGAASDEYGGPQILTINGTIADHVIRFRLTRTNSCRIARWDALERVFGLPLTLTAP